MSESSKAAAAVFITMICVPNHDEVQLVAGVPYSLHTLVAVLARELLNERHETGHCVVPSYCTSKETHVLDKCSMCCA